MWYATVTPRLRGRDWSIRKAHWPVSQPECMSYKFNQSLMSHKNAKYRIAPKSHSRQMYANIHRHRHTHPELEILTKPSIASV